MGERVTGRDLSKPICKCNIYFHFLWSPSLSTCGKSVYQCYSGVHILTHILFLFIYSFLWLQGRPRLHLALALGTQLPEKCFVLFLDAAEAISAGACAVSVCVCMCSRQLEALARLAAFSTASFRPGTGAGTGNLAASCSSIWNAFFLGHFSHSAWLSLPCDCWANIFLISCLKNFTTFSLSVGWPTVKCEKLQLKLLYKMALGAR